jgi:hypothetical protein
MRDKFSRAEAVHKLLIDVEFQVGNPVPYMIDFRQAVQIRQADGYIGAGCGLIGRF